MSTLHKTHVIFDEHIILRQLEERGIPSYELIKEVDVFDVPQIVSFFDIINKYLKMKELLVEDSLS